MNFLKKISKKKKGIISILGVLFLGIIIILILSYFNISIKAVVNSPTGQENVNYVGGGAKSLWTTYLAEPAAYLWNDIWIELFWKPFVSNMIKIRDTGRSDLENAAPTVNFR